MKSRMQAVAAVVLATSLVVSYAQTSDAPPPQTKKHHVVRKEETPPGPTVEEQIQTLREQMQTQIDSLKSDLAAKDAQLQQAQQAAADAQAAAAKAQAAADAEQQSLTENSAAVTTLQSTVTDLKGNQASLATTISDETSAMKKEISAPEAIHYKGVTISPAGSFLAGETDWRSGATGGGLNTSFTGIPLAHSEAAQVSEFGGTGRQSRIAIKAIGKTDRFTLTGYYEMDWLGTGITSNNNQSDSYVLRMRQLWGEARTNGGWSFSGGQGWSLAAETTAGLQRGSEILPATIDPQYEAGFVWTRQYSFRVTKDFANKFFFGISAENPQALNAAGQNLNTNLLIGSAGTSGGLYNPGESASGSTIANYSFNVAPDMIAKLALEPGWGHWELFGIARAFRDRIYPAAAANDIASQAVCGATTPCNNTVWSGGVGGGFRGPLAGKKVTIGLKGLWGQGVGRYGSSTIADITLRPDGTISPIHAFSALGTVEVNPTNRLMLYFNYGGDYVARDWVLDSVTGDADFGKEVGYGTYTEAMYGCNTENSASDSDGDATSAPVTPTDCGANNKDVQEFTAGDWYNIYAGPKGRLRFGLQYSLIRRDLWSGSGVLPSGTTLTNYVPNPNGGANGEDNMFFTSFRYYLP